MTSIEDRAKAFARAQSSGADPEIATTIVNTVKVHTTGISGHKESGDPLPTIQAIVESLLELGAISGYIAGARDRE